MVSPPPYTGRPPLRELVGVPRASARGAGSERGPASTLRKVEPPPPEVGEVGGRRFP